MKLVTMITDRGLHLGAAISSSAASANAGEVHYLDLTLADSNLPRTMRELLALGKSGMAQAQRAASLAVNSVLKASGVRLAAPVPDPRKVICVGLNYADHARESGVEPPPEPVIFNKFPTSICAPGDAIVLPKNAEQIDYEAELVVVIGEGGKNIAAANASHHIAGYCCGHDVSARDWQLHKPGKQWLLGKTIDTFAPCGPWLVTADEVPDPGNLKIELRLNGETMQSSTTAQLIFSIAEVIAYVSSVATLEPGDLIFTGTPPGVGMARKPPVFLKPGDKVEVEIEKLGVLHNDVVPSC
jgi:2-keto-4-pentenoate hydratase/2-oxohepta-3-ene-1,7-dioic acid hydratase in catechol pathway